MSTSSSPFRPDDPRAEPRYDTWPPGTAAAGVPVTPDATADAWEKMLDGANQLHRSGALDRGVELRHVRRCLQPLADSLLAGELVATALADVAPGESAAAHAAHTSLAAMCIAGALGLPRASIADVGVAAMLHDVGHGWARAAHGHAHTLEGVRHVLRSTTWSPLTVSVLQVVLAHHRDRGAPLVAQVVSAADAYVTLLAQNDGATPWLSPAGSLARVLGALRAHSHPALPTAMVRALGLYPPGQVVQLDDGSFARALAPQLADPARPWIARLVDARGLPVPAWASAPTPLPVRRTVVRALPRQEWPEIAQERPAA